MAKRDLVDREHALEHLMELLEVEGPSGRERGVATLVHRKLLAAGCRPAWMRHDDAHRRIGRGFEIGNLIVKVPGRRRSPRRLFASHLDTVPLCRGAVPVRKGKRIVARGDTALGGDNRTAVAALVVLAETLLAHDLPHPPLTLLFTVGEEVGLCGSRNVRPADLGGPRWGVNVDSGKPAEIIVGAVGADRWHAEVRGIASHAGVHPEHGVSATLIASKAIADVAAKGYFGKVVKGRFRGTSNVGTFQGGEAVNQVTDRVLIEGESRSHSRGFVPRITAAYRNAFERAARSVENHQGRRGSIVFSAERDYEPFLLKKTSPVVRFAAATARAWGFEPSLRVANGGLDANWLNAKGIPTVTVGAGQHGAHTVGEYVDTVEYVDGCRLLVALATAEG